MARMIEFDSEFGRGAYLEYMKDMQDQGAFLNRFDSDAPGYADSVGMEWWADKSEWNPVTWTPFRQIISYFSGWSTARRYGAEFDGKTICLASRCDAPSAPIRVEFSEGGVRNSVDAATCS